MRMLRGRAERLGIPLGELTLAGEVGPLGELVALSLVRGAEPVAVPPPGCPEFEEARPALAGLDLLPAIGTGRTFSMPFDEVCELADAWDVMMDYVVGTADEAAYDEATWTRFRHSEAFRAEPCDRARFIALRDEFAASRYAVGMRIADYYAWWRRSAEMFSPGGEPLQETRDAAHAVLSGLVSRGVDDPARLRSMLAGRLRAHPAHRQALEPLVEESLVAAQDGGAPAP